MKKLFVFFFAMLCFSFASPKEVEKARELLDNHWYREKEALVVLEKAYRTYADDPEVMFEYAKVLYLLRKYSQAAEVLKQVWNKNPQMAKAHAYYAYCIGRLADKEKNAGKQLNMQMEAKSHLEKALKLDPEFAEGWLAYAIGMHHFGKRGNLKWAFEDAEKKFKKVFQLTPRDPYALVEYGYLKLTLGKKNEADTYFQRAMKLAERDVRDGMKNSDIPRSIAIYLEDHSYFEEALQFAKIALEWNPEDRHTFPFQSIKKIINRLKREIKTGKKELKSVSDEL